MANYLFQKYEVKPAVVSEYHKNPQYKDWIYSVARKVDVTNPQELALVRDLSIIMRGALRKYGWAGVSSNNLYWNGTDRPIRVTMVPHPDGQGQLTIVNPVIISKQGVEYENIEGCGSIPDALYSVKRFSSVVVSGHLLHGSGLTPVELEYGLKNATLDEILNGDNPPITDAVVKAEYIQHEVDHLNGIIIADKGVIRPKR